ncbi:MFS transporter [Jannaschia sp. EhC01]|nr:MFS transporter [Jannaschia sp. EhC01]
MSHRTAKKNLIANGLRAPREAIIGPIVAYIAFVMELTLTPLLLPAIMAQFDLTVGDLAWLFNSYGAAVAAGVLFCGYCGDNLDTKRVFGLGVALFASGSLLSATAQNYEMFIVGRILQGIGSGVFSPLVPIFLTRASPRAPGRALIVWGSISGYIAAFAPLLYASVLGEHSWRFAFAFVAIIAAVALVLSLGPHAPSESEPDSARNRGYSAILRSRGLLLTFAYVFCTYGCITYYLFQLPVLLSENEIVTSYIGVFLSMTWLCFSGLSTLLRNFVDRHHIQVIMLVAPLLIAGGVLLLFNHQSILFVALSSISVGAGLACSNAPSTQLILRFAPAGMSAVATSLDITFARLGGIAAVSILVGFEAKYVSFAVCLLCLFAAICAVNVSRLCVRAS